MVSEMYRFLYNLHLSVFVLYIYKCIYISHHVKEIKVHKFMHDTVTLIFPEIFNLKFMKCLKFKLQFSYRVCSYNT